MRSDLEGRKITIYLEGDLNSFNADSVENDLESILKGKKLDSVVLDFNDLNYISSAGLRIILRIKKRYDDLTLINLSEDVYKVFEMVGFDSLLTIERK
ncbi:MAG: STAS domain-containing protein [Bacilli bacterium]|nr:STAS domain-containing protein [Bacilli bacterium]